MSAPERSEGAGLVPSGTSVRTGSGFVVKFGAPDPFARVRRMRMALWGAAHFLGLAKPGCRPPVAHMLTLTYRDAKGWRSDHMADFVRLLRRWCAFRALPFRYAWVAEIQDGSRVERVEGHRVVRGRGAVHYHVLLWLPEGTRAPKPDQVVRVGARTRGVLWPHGMTQSEPARSGVGYLMKYASKGNREGFTFPRGLRVFGIGGLEDAGKQVRRWLALPEWCKRLSGVGEVVRAGSRLVVRATGELLESPWVRERCEGGVRLSLTRPMGERWFSGPYSRVGAPA